MYHVDNSTGVPVMPQPSPVTSETELFFTEGGNGVPPTFPGPDWFNIIQSELINILRAAGLDPDKMDNTQILAALKKLFLSRSNPFGDIKADGAAAIATALSNLGLDRIEQLSIETKIKSPGGGTYLFVDENKWGCFVSGTGNLALGIEYGGTGANTASGALTKLGIGPIASAAEVTSGTPKKLVDAERLVGAIATDSDIQSATVKKLVDAAGLINAITTMQNIRDGALRKLVNAQSLKNYLPTKALGASGFIRIPDVPGGTIIQWGQVVKSITEGLENVVLPTPFPTSGRFAIAIPLNQSGNSSIDITPHLVAASQTGINFYFSWGTTSTPADGFQWLALGY
ncbi:gp53-like domain-containing protein [Enterobacter roggenkampii]|uniref:gp53-like domain-containing protein n=1 Tax=Enterobacter roggenkampii TaxID=1812935 RepID=UPI0020182292|nr:hypothetical protein [Enterobacter roggenkampii]